MELLLKKKNEKIQKKRKDNKKNISEFLCNSGGWTEIHCETNQKKKKC